MIYFGKFVSSCKIFSISLFVFLILHSIVINANLTKSDGPGWLSGFQLESSDVARHGEEDEITDFRAQVYPDTVTDIRLFGIRLKPSSWISFTTEPGDRDSDCNDIRSTGVFRLHLINDSNNVATASISLPPLPSTSHSETFYFCLREETNSSEEKHSFVIFRHQGSESWMQIVSITRPVKSHILPTWLQIIMVSFLLVFSGLFSGLNLGLMSLDVTELNIMINSGTKSEKRYAKTILPLRRKGNFLLCTILLGNVLVNNTLAILLDDLTGSGLLAILGATVAIVVFGEIIPQAICSRYGLMVGARTILFTKFFMVITFPLSYPISLILDCILGKEIGYVFNRDRLRELIRITEDKIDLEREELKIISGALELSKKSISDVMTKIEDVFMIEIGSTLNFDMMNSIVKTGYTRIPVYEGSMGNIVALLNVKDLAFVDPDDATPLKAIISFYKHPLHFFPAETRLDIILQVFKKGSSHMAFVQKSCDPGQKKETIGIVTLEDVIEEILQSEIVDETDIITDNKAKSPLKNAFAIRDFSYFSQKSDQKPNSLSPQMALATFRFLSTSVSAFNPELVSETVLQRLIKENVIRNLDLRSSSTAYLYEAGKVTDHFCMVLEGRVEVEFGKDKVIFEGGPFVYFGVQALIGPPCCQCAKYPNVACILEHIGSGKPHDPYVADYTVKAVTNLQYLCIKRAHYIVAVKATTKERRKLGTNAPYSLNSNNNNNISTVNSNLMIEEIAADSDMNASQVVSLIGPSTDFGGQGETKVDQYGGRKSCNHHGVGSLNSLPGYSSEKRDSINGGVLQLHHFSNDTCQAARKRGSLHSLRGPSIVNFLFRDKKFNSKGQLGHS